MNWSSLIPFILSILFILSNSFFVFPSLLTESTGILANANVSAVVCVRIDGTRTEG